MQPHWAEKNLQVIRTLMERSAVYRRALAPVMLLTGAVGCVAAIAGLALHYETPSSFIRYWMIVSVVPLGASYLLARRQASKDAEPFWSPPLRRVTQAALPPMTAGFLAGLILLIHLNHTEPDIGRVLGMVWLPVGWIILYGCAVHAAGFFMPRGMKLFGWLFIAGGSVLFAAGIPDISPSYYAHGVMGTFFGGMHLAYGIYLFLSERKKNAV